MGDVVETHLCKLCVILRSRVLLGVSSYYYFITNISRTSAVSSTNFRSILIFASCVVGTRNILLYKSTSIPGILVRGYNSSWHYVHLPYRSYFGLFKFQSSHFNIEPRTMDHCTIILERKRIYRLVRVFAVATFRTYGVVATYSTCYDVQSVPGRIHGNIDIFHARSHTVPQSNFVILLLLIMCTAVPCTTTTTLQTPVMYYRRKIVNKRKKKTSRRGTYLLP